MEFSRRTVLGTALAALVTGPSRAAPLPLEAQGGQYTSFDGAQLFYRRMGKGPPVILLHSFISDGPRTWFNTGIAQAVTQAGFSVVAPDARAHGLSAAPPGPYPKDTLAMDVEALIRVLGLKSYRLFGYAMGSRTALRLILRGARPERAVLGGSGPVTVFGVEHSIATTIHAIQTGRDARDPQLGVLVQSAIRLQKLNTQALISVLKSEGSTPRADLAQAKVPILVLNGDTDRLEGAPGDLAALLPDAAVSSAPGNHFTVVREPRFAQTGAAFLQSRDPPARFIAPAL